MARQSSTHSLILAVSVPAAGIYNMYFVKTNMNQRSSTCLKIFTVKIELKAILLLYKKKKKITQ